MSWFLCTVLDKGPTAFFYMWIYIVLYTYIYFFQHYFLKRLSYLHLAIYMWVYFWATYSAPLLYMSVTVPAPNCFNSCCFVIYFEARKCDASIFVVLSQDGFGYLGYFLVPSEFYNCFCYFCKKYHLVLIRIALNL